MVIIAKICLCHEEPLEVPLSTERVFSNVEEKVGELHQTGLPCLDRTDARKMTSQAMMRWLIDALSHEMVMTAAETVWQHEIHGAQPNH